MSNQNSKITRSLFFSLFLLLLFLCGGLNNSFAQSCCGDHLVPQFNQFSISDTVYASNQENYDGSYTDLSVRIWNAVGNDCQTKPLLILIHGGGFIAGYPSLMDSLCKTFAARGYLTASIEYRLGWVGEGYCAVDSTEGIRAWYRAVDDCQKATFFFKDNSLRYGIDSNLIFLSGWSAGGYAATGAAFLDDINEKPQVCESMNSLVLPTNQIVLRPDLGQLPGFFRDPSYKGVITFSSSVLLPGLLSIGSNEPVLAFNNQNDPYLVPIATCDAWYNIDDCAETFPVSCGWASDALTDYSSVVEQHVFQESTCPHNLHDPCFPKWNQEVEIMSEFMNSKMNCDLVLTSKQTNLKSPATALVCKSMTEIQKILDENTSWKLYSAIGNLIASDSKHLETLEQGCYYLQLESHKQVTLICHIQ